MNIAVFLFAYPVLSETFIINELYQLQQKRVQGNIWREKRGNGEVHPKAKNLHLPVFDCPEKVIGEQFRELLSNHVWWLTHYPLRYIKLLIEVLYFFPDIELLKIFWKSVLPARQVNDSQADLVYVHESDRAFVFGLCAARLSNLPLVVIFHTYYLFVQKKYVLPKVKCADGVIFQSEYSRKIVAEMVGNSSAVLQKLHVVSSPGIDTDFFHPKTDVKKKIGKLKVVSIGRLEEAKAFHTLIEAVALLKKRGIEVRCRIIGEGSLRTSLEKLIAKLQLKKNVALGGSLPHNHKLQTTLQNADLFVLPSVRDSEGVHDVHPNAVKEAMATGLLTLTTMLGGIDEVIEDEVDGFLVSHATPELIAQKMEYIHKLPVAQKKKIKQSARKKIVENFDASSVTDQLLMIFQAYAR